MCHSSIEQLHKSAIDLLVSLLDEHDQGALNTAEQAEAEYARRLLDQLRREHLDGL